MSRAPIRMLRATAGEGRCRVFLELRPTDGHGLCCLLGGGELPHVGGVVLATPRDKANGEGLTSNLWIITVPDHQDTEIGRSIAHRLCVATGEPVSLTVGLYIDNASREETALLYNNSRQAAERLIAAYLAQKGGCA